MAHSGEGGGYSVSRKVCRRLSKNGGVPCTEKAVSKKEVNTVVEKVVGMWARGRLRQLLPDMWGYAWGRRSLLPPGVTRRHNMCHKKNNPRIRPHRMPQIRHIL